MSTANRHLRQDFSSLRGFSCNRRQHRAKSTPHYIGRKDRGNPSDLQIRAPDRKSLIHCLQETCGSTPMVWLRCPQEVAALVVPSWSVSGHWQCQPQTPHPRTRSTTHKVDCGVARDRPSVRLAVDHQPVLAVAQAAVDFKVDRVAHYPHRAIVPLMTNGDLTPNLPSVTPRWSRWPSRSRGRFRRGC